jgi:phosphopantetheinyl transferase
VPHISIAHAGGQAIALAAARAVGVDIEQIVPRDAHCVASFCTAPERQLLAVVPDAGRDAWTTRLWCAKEAFAKRLGIGVAGGPHRFEAQTLEPDFSLHMRHAASGVDTTIQTVQDGEFVLAFDTAAIAR